MPLPMYSAPPLNPRPYLYLPQGWNSGWLAAKAGVGSSPAIVACLGDSIANGFNATDPMTQSWFELVRNYLITTGGLPLGGDYYGNYPYGSDNLGSPATAPPWGAFTGATKNLNNHPFGKYYNNTAANASWYQRFTFPYAATDADLLWYDSFSGTWQYRIDGGSGVTETNTSTGTQSTTSLKKIQLTGLSNAIHTIDIGQASAVGSCSVPGISVFKSRTSGVMFARHQANGLKLFNLNDTTGVPMPKVQNRIMGGITPADSVGPWALTGFGFPAEPALLIIALGVNDANAAVTDVSQYEQILNNLISGLRDAHSTASVLLLANAGPDGFCSDCVPSGFTLTKYGAYVDAMLRVAIRRQCAFVDIDQKWGFRGNALGFMATNNIHPTTAGHADIAAVLESII